MHSLCWKEYWGTWGLCGCQDNAFHVYGQGEVYALVAAGVYARRNQSHAPTTYTDHLNAERIISSALVLSFQHRQWSSLPARSLYRWLLHNISHSNVQNTSNIIYTPAHTNSTSLPSQINNAADNLATYTQTTLLRPPPAPVPTIFMDHFVLYTSLDGYIESNI